MEDIYEQLDDAFDKLWEECGCSHSKTTNVKGNLARRALNDASNEKKVKMAKKAIEPAEG
jgi:hypothetical protein